MTSKNFYFKLVRDEARRNLWALALSVLGFLFALPLPVMMRAQATLEGVGTWGQTEEMAREQLFTRLREGLSGEWVFARAGLMVMAVMCGIVLFRFWHDRRQVDFYCALPIRRGALYAVKFLTGLLLVLPAYFAAEVIAAVAVAGFGVPVPWGGLFQCIGIDLFAFFMIYSISILCTLLCGNTLFAVPLDLFVLISPALIGLIYDAFAAICYPAYCQNGNTYLMRSPLIGFLLAGEIFFSRFFVWYLLAGVAALVLSVVLFRCRHGECAGKALAFAPLGLPLKIYICLIMGIGTACLLSVGISAYGGWLFLFTAVATAACHCVIEAVYQGEARAMFGHLPTLLAVTAASLALVFGLQNDVLGYSRWIPGENSVEWVELYNLYCIDEDASFNIGRYYDFARDERLADPEVVRAMLELARIGTENLDLQATSIMGWAESEEVSRRRAEINRYYDCAITFGLSGGREQNRQYTIPSTPETEALVNSILYSEEYLFWHNRVFRFEEFWGEHPERLPSMVFEDTLRGETVRTLRGREQIENMIEALKADVLDFTPGQAAEEGVLMTVCLGSYDAETPENVNYYSIAVYPSYQRTLALIREYAGYEPKPLSADEVGSIVVTDRRRMENGEGMGNTRRVNDPEVIALLLENMVCDDESDRYGMAVNMLVSADIYLDNGNYIHMKYPADKIPEALLDTLFGGPVEAGEGPGTAVSTTAA